MEINMTQTNIPEDKSSAVVLTDKHGGVRYLNEFGQIHRDGDLPALVNHEGTFYFKNGLLHRENGPAAINSHQEVYYKDGLIHRDGDLPALINFIKDKENNKEVFSQAYYKHGKFHRENGPALIWTTGSYQHYKNGLLHNENGPACHYVKSGKTEDEYWLNGESVTKIGHKIRTLRNNLLSNENHKKYKP
jgi:hypothetical protein